MSILKDPTEFSWKFLLPSAILLAFVFIYPMTLFLSKSFLDPHPTLKHVFELFDNPVYVKVFWITFKISLTVTLTCVLLGYPFAYILSEDEYCAIRL